MARYTDALDYFFKALTIREALGEIDETAASLNNIGLVYRDIADFSKAIEYQQKALEIYEKNNNKIQTAVTLNNLANVYSASATCKKPSNFICRRCA
jgi:tetratricopeptide (TPR) repeat protein